MQSLRIKKLEEGAKIPFRATLHSAGIDLYALLKEPVEIGSHEICQIHTGIACDTRPYKDFLAEDFLPFEAGIEAGAEMALVSHNIVSCIDPDRPASLSPAVHTVLRETLGFTGVIVTDDLAMDGVRDFTGDAEAAVLAVEAGNDLLCCTDFETQIPAVVDAVRSGRLSEEQIDAAAGRVLAMKINAGILA